MENALLWSTLWPFYHRANCTLPKAYTILISHFSKFHAWNKGEWLCNKIIISSLSLRGLDNHELELKKKLLTKEFCRWINNIKIVKVGSWEKKRWLFLFFVCSSFTRSHPIPMQSQVTGIAWQVNNSSLR